MGVRALSQFVLKVHSRCDLACDHCYVYEHADQSWRDRPRVMAIPTLRAAATRIAEHAATHGLARVSVILHGGEPLLVGLSGLRTVLAELTAVITPVTALDLRMQSNGVLLTEAICDLLAGYGVRVGISLDGDRDANDRHRRYANGASSHADVLRALELLRRPGYRHLYAGILCTVDLRNDPIRTYRALAVQQPPRVDFLLPHATWDNPPVRPDGEDTPYASWLLQVYQAWQSDGQPVRVRLYDSLRSAAAGGIGGSEWVGLDPVDLVVIETDGAWEQVDSLKTAYAGAPATGLTVFDHPADTVAALPAVARRQRGLADLSATCRGCEVVRQCGGGLFAHRYRSGTGFDNPSVYCADLKRLILDLRTHPALRPVSIVDPAPDVGPAAASDGGLGDAAAVELVDELATGYASAAMVERLAGHQLAITRALVATVAQSLLRTDEADRAWQLLLQLDRTAPELVDRVLAHPYVRVWAVGCLAGRRDGVPVETDHLCRLAAATAGHAGIPADLVVPVDAGTVVLPTLGRVRLPDAGTATVRVSTGPGGALQVAGRTVDLLAPEGWRPVPTVELHGWAVGLEDQDPYRDCNDWPVTGELSEVDILVWRDALARAWARLGEEAPGHLAGLRRLRVLTPLVVDPAGGLRSATARQAFGAVGVAVAGPDALAVMLVHELQHMKLGAVLDLVDLYDPHDPTRLQVGWRPDPRPIEGVLQGTYAHLAVADIWRARAMMNPDAVEPYRRYRDWTWSAIDALMANGALTGLGRRFVAGLAETVSAWAR
jgi:uncharacterized protein